MATIDYNRNKRKWEEFLSTLKQEKEQKTPIKVKIRKDGIDCLAYDFANQLFENAKGKATVVAKESSLQPVKDRIDIGEEIRQILSKATSDTHNTARDFETSSSHKEMIKSSVKEIPQINQECLEEILYERHSKSVMNPKNLEHLQDDEGISRQRKPLQSSKPTKCDVQAIHQTGEEIQWTTKYETSPSKHQLSQSTEETSQENTIQKGLRTTYSSIQGQLDDVKRETPKKRKVQTVNEGDGDSKVEYSDNIRTNKSSEITGVLESTTDTQRNDQPATEFSNMLTNVQQISKENCVSSQLKTLMTAEAQEFETHSTHKEMIKCTPELLDESLLKVDVIRQETQNLQGEEDTTRQRELLETSKSAKYKLQTFCKSGDEKYNEIRTNKTEKLQRSKSIEETSQKNTLQEGFEPPFSSIRRQSDVKLETSKKRKLQPMYESDMVLEEDHGRTSKSREITLQENKLQEGLRTRYFSPLGQSDAVIHETSKEKKLQILSESDGEYNDRSSNSKEINEVLESSTDTRENDLSAIEISNNLQEKSKEIGGSSHLNTDKSSAPEEKSETISKHKEMIECPPQQVTQMDQESNGEIMYERHLKSIVNTQDIKDLQGDVEISRKRERAHRLPTEQKTDIDKPCSNWNMVMFARYFNFETLVSPLTLPTEARNSQSLLKRVKEEINKRRFAIPEHQTVPSKDCFFKRMRTNETGVRLLLDSIFIPLCSELGLKLEVNKSVECDMLVPCVFDYRLTRNGKVVGCIEAKSADGLKKASIIQAVLQLTILQAERVEKDNEIPLLFNIVTDGVRYIFLQLYKKQLRFEFDHNGRLSVNRAEDIDDLCLIVPKILKLLENKGEQGDEKRLEDKEAIFID